MRKFLLPISIIIAGLIIAGALIYLNQGKVEEGLSPQEAAEKAIDFINQNQEMFGLEGITASLVDAVEENGVYKFHLKIGENEFESYVTKNGKILFVEGIDLEFKPVSTQEEEVSEIPKREIPDVKLFVMSYCPYGLQAQKMFLPVYDLLKDKTEMGVYFVNYIMHEKKEIDENLRQYCIQKEEKEKYYDYLNCFVATDDFEKCLSEADIQTERLTACISATDEEHNVTSQYNDKSTWIGSTCPEPPYCFPKFDVHTDLNEEYGVQGSPTIVINDEIANVSQRSPEEFKKVVCQAFNSPPEECSQILSGDVASIGIGGGTGSSSGGSCQ